MTEEITQEPEREEVAHAEVEPTSSDGANQVEPGAIEEESSETPEEINWRKFREGRQKDRQAAIEANKRAEEESRAREAMQSYVADVLQGMGAKGQLSPAQQEQIVEDLDDADIPTGGEIKAFVRRQIESGVREALQEQKRIQEVRSLPERIAETMPDFDQVCSQENTDYLEHIAPTLAKALSKPLQDKENVSYTDLKAIYEAVVKMVPNAKAAAKKAPSQTPQEDRPKSMSTTTANQGRDSAPMMMSDELRQQRYKEMMMAARGMS